MQTITATVTINPAFFQELKDDSHDLRRLVDSVRAILEVPTWRSLLRRRMAELMQELQEVLAMQFALEEAYGYFDQPLELDSSICQRAESLRAEHPALQEEIAAIAQRAKQLSRRSLAPGPLRDLASRFQHFEEQLQAHEAREAELIEEARCQDWRTWGDNHFPGRQGKGW